MTMNQAELRRRARFMAAEMLTSDVEAMTDDIASYTDGSEEETAALTAALLRVADMIRRPLPPGYQLDPVPIDRIQEKAGRSTR